MMKYLLAICILSISGLCSTQISAQNLNMIECLEVLPNGNVIITWTPYDNTNNDFLFYQVNKRLATETDADYVNLSGGIVDANTLTFTDTSAGTDANTTEYCYQVIANNSGGGGAVIYTSLCTLLIDAQLSADGGSVNVSWNDPATSLTAIPSGAIYNLLYEFPAGTWNTGASFFYAPNLEFYSYEVVTCSAFVNFQLQLEMPGASCVSSSNIVGLNVEDINAPDTPVIASVSVDSLSGNALIDWFSVSATDAAGYVIYECDPIFGEQIIDVIYDPNLTEYIYAGSNASTAPESFLVASFDDCVTGTGPPNTGNLSVTQSACPSIYESMLLTSQWAPCQQYVDLAWTQYQGWGEDNVAYYEVFRRTNNGPDELLAQVEPEENTFRDSSIGNDIEYTYYIKAFSGDIDFFATCITNLEIVNVDTPDQPAVFNLASASVNINQEVEITVNTAPTPTVFDYALQRKKVTDPFFTTLLVESTDSENTLEFTDNDVEPDVFSYIYRIALLNTCNDTVAFSNLGKTMLLDAVYDDINLINSLSWTPYAEWQNGISTYDIYRSVDDGPFAYLTTNNSNISFLEDDVTTELQSEGNFCYRVVASEFNNPLGTDAESTSNEFCVSQPPKIWIPNAFALNGINDEFKPVASFVDRDTYQMIIFNRWGQEIWETTDLDVGWDGRIEGELVQEGNYMYYVGIRNGEGKLFEFRGPLTLLIFDSN